MEGANLGRCQESQKTIVISEFSTFKLFTMLNFMVISSPHSPFPNSHPSFPVPRPPFPFLKIAISLSFNAAKYISSETAITFWTPLRYNNDVKITTKPLSILLEK